MCKSFLCTGALLLAVATPAAFAQQVDTPPTEPSTACFSTYNSVKMPVCFSDHGNVMRIESPLGVEHIRVGSLVEGYAVCAAFVSGGAQVSAFDRGNTEANFGAPTIVQPGGPNTLPLTITRTTTNSSLRLTQQFDRDTNERDIKITMTLTNLSATTRFNVLLDRFFDGDISGDAGDDLYAKSLDSVWGFETFAQALVLSDITFPAASHRTSVQTFAGFNAGDCNQASVATPTAAGDFVGRISYGIGTLPAGSSRQVQVIYHRL